MNKNDKKHKIEQSGNHFLKNDSHKNDISREHRKYLGMEVPDGYFSKSKDEIIKSLSLEKERRRTVFGFKPIIAYPIAASILLLIGFTFWIQTSNVNMDITSVDSIESLDMVSPEDGFLVSSLLVDDAKMDQFLDDYILNEIIVEVELSAQKLENIFINSLFIEDSFVNNYLDNTLLENFIL